MKIAEQHGQQRSLFSPRKLSHIQSVKIPFTEFPFFFGCCCCLFVFRNTNCSLFRKRQTRPQGSAVGSVPIRESRVSTFGSPTHPPTACPPAGGPPDPGGRIWLHAGAWAPQRGFGHSGRRVITLEGSGLLGVSGAPWAANAPAPVPVAAFPAACNRNTTADERKSRRQPVNRRWQNRTSPTAAASFILLCFFCFVLFFKLRHFLLLLLLLFLWITFIL